MQESGVSFPQGRSRRLVLAGLLAVAGGLFASTSAYASSKSPEELLREATRESSYSNYDLAGRMFGQVVEKAKPGSELWQQALLGEAVCLQHRQPGSSDTVAKATDLYKRLIAEAPKTPYAARAIMNLGRIAELSDYYQDPIDLPAARSYYQQVIDGWPNDAIASEALLRISATYIQQYTKEDAAKGVGLLEDWLAKHPQDPLASVMWQYVGDTYYFPLEDYRKCVTAYQNADRLGWVEKSRIGETFWRIAKLAQVKLQDRELAVQYYTRIIKEAPNSGKAYESQLALKQLGAPVPEIALFSKHAASATQPATMEGRP